MVGWQGTGLLVKTKLMEFSWKQSTKLIGVRKAANVCSQTQQPTFPPSVHIWHFKWEGVFRFSRVDKQTQLLIYTYSGEDGSLICRNFKHYGITYYTCIDTLALVCHSGVTGVQSNQARPSYTQAALIVANLDWIQVVCNSVLGWFCDSIERIQLQTLCF